MEYCGGGSVEAAGKSTMGITLDLKAPLLESEIKCIIRECLVVIMEFIKGARVSSFTEQNS